MSVPVAPSQLSTNPASPAPISNAASGANHQKIKGPSAASLATGAYLLDSALPSATIGSAYSTTLTAGGGTSPYAFSLQSGSLPTGLSLSSSGVISGTTTGTAGTSSFTVLVTDANGQTGSQAFTIARVAAAVPTNYGFIG
jgi:hypothetical protein